MKHHEDNSIIGTQVTNRRLDLGNQFSPVVSLGRRRPVVQVIKRNRGLLRCDSNVRQRLTAIVMIQGFSGRESSQR